MTQTAFAGKEIAQHLAATVGQNAPDNLGAMVEPAIAGDLIEGVAGPRLGIGSAVHHGGQPGQDDRSGTHGARLECDVQNAIVQAPGSQGIGGLRDRNHFRMGGRIVQCFTLIVGPGNDPLLHGHDDGSNRHFILGGCQVRFLQGHFHVMKMERMPWIAQGQIEGGPGFHARIIQRLQIGDCRLQPGR